MRVDLRNVTLLGSFLKARENWGNWLALTFLFHTLLVYFSNIFAL